MRLARQTRSLLYVPGNTRRMIDRALGLREFEASSLDVAILDLEDGTPLSEKEAARTIVREALGLASNGGTGPLRFVRVNCVREQRFEDDLDAVISRGVNGVVLPKVESANEVLDAAARVAELEGARGLVATFLVPSIESARGLMQSLEIASSSPRVLGLLLGGEDYSLSLGLPSERSGEARELLFARSWLVNAAAAAGVLSFDGVWPAIKDLEGLRRDTVQARRLGFSGKSAIHPGHISTINDVFTPTAAEVAHARRVLSAFEDAESRHRGAVALDGKILDRPIVERARRVLRMIDTS